MSKKHELKNEVRSAIAAMGGSKKTKHDYFLIADRFVEIVWNDGYQIVDIDGICVKHIKAYIALRLDDEIGERTLQNEMTVVRRILRAAGRVAFANAPEISNETLGIGGASRAGTKVPVPDSIYQTAYEGTLAIDEGVAAIFGLERRIGLRGQEGVMANQSLEDWAKFVDRGDTKITVIHGTKGGRARDATLHRLNEAIAAIHFALNVMQRRGGYLIEAETLGSALNRYHRIAARVGLTGIYAPHSLRYAYAVEGVDAYLQKGHSLREAQALAAMDLGHGSGRGRLVREVYGRMPNANQSDQSNQTVVPTA